MLLRLDENVGAKPFQGASTEQIALLPTLAIENESTLKEEHV